MLTAPSKVKIAIKTTLEIRSALTSALIQSIKQAFKETTPGSHSSEFVPIGAAKDERLARARTIPDHDLRMLLNFADSYFDAVADDFPEVQRGLNVDDAGPLLWKLVEQLETTGSLNSALLQTGH